MLSNNVFKSHQSNLVQLRQQSLRIAAHNVWHFKKALQQLRVKL